MRIAVVGGGAAGLTTAHLLDSRHEVTLFEAAPVLGGNVRTLGGNVPLPAGCKHKLDAGVIEFEANLFPHVVALFERLGVPTEPVPVASTLFLQDGRRLMDPNAVGRAGLSLAGKAKALWNLRGFYQARRGFQRAAEQPLRRLYEEPLSKYLPDSPYGVWLELLATYAHSTKQSDVGDMPAAMVVPVLKDFIGPTEWFRVVGGVYTYVQAIEDRFKGQIRTGTPVTKVRRGESVYVCTADGDSLHFDQVVLALTPDRVLEVLADPDREEVRRFGSWRGRDIETVVHRDKGPYERRGAAFATEFDLFERSEGGGYNAWLNGLCGVPADSPDYGLAFGMDGGNDPAQVLHRQPHRVPSYTVDALASRTEVQACNGSRHTWFAGAWLGNGLHEGAVRSGALVARALGGDSL